MSTTQLPADIERILIAHITARQDEANGSTGVRRKHMNQRYDEGRLILAKLRFLLTEVHSPAPTTPPDPASSSGGGSGVDGGAAWRQLVRDWIEGGARRSPTGDHRTPATENHSQLAPENGSQLAQPVYTRAIAECPALADINGRLS